MSPLLIFRDQELLELAQQANILVMVKRLVEREENPFKQSALTHHCIRDEANRYPVINAVQELPQQRGLAAADFTSDHCKTGLIENAIFQHAVGKTVVPPPIQKIGIRKHRKWPRRQAVISLIHRSLLNHLRTLCHHDKFCGLIWNISQTQFSPLGSATREVVSIMVVLT